jgi:hypothetical protein
MSKTIPIMLTAATLIYEVISTKLPLTITLTSVGAGRKIELSTDGGNEYFTPTIDTTSATMLIVTVNAPISNIKVTGAVSDKLTLVY